MLGSTGGCASVSSGFVLRFLRSFRDGGDAADSGHWAARVER